MKGIDATVITQEESLSCSENCKWRIRKGFESGRPWTCRMLGYQLVDGEYSIVPEEAKIVKRVFELYMAGNGLQKTANILNEEGIKHLYGGSWRTWQVKLILDNEKYAGDLKLQKCYRQDHLSKVCKQNRGELPSFFVEEDHIPIIDKETFNKVQQMRSTKRISAPPVRGNMSAFTGIIRCAGCGKNYRRKTTACRVVWCCTTYNTRGKKYCPTSKVIPEETLKKLAATALNTDCFDEKKFSKEIVSIDACLDNTLVFHFSDGMEKELIWADRSRSESWTPEKREAARMKALEKRCD